MFRYEIINALIKKYDFKSYLEIGVQHGSNYKAIECGDKWGVDPNPRCDDASIRVMGSDDFFKTNQKTFDIIFIDGLHHADQVLRDIDNSLRFLNKGGFVVLHDCNPIAKENQTIPFAGQHFWNGDVWKAFIIAGQHYPYEMFTIDTDHGIGIINTRKEVELEDHEPLTIEELHYEDLEKFREEWLNLKDVQYFNDFMGEK